MYKPEQDVKRQVDPKQQQFGQKIDGKSDGAPENYMKVRRVISPEIIELDDFKRVRLIGVKRTRHTEGKPRCSWKTC